MITLKQEVDRKKEYSSLTYYELIDKYCARCDAIREEISHLPYLTDEPLGNLFNVNKRDMPNNEKELVSALVRLDLDYGLIKSIEKQLFIQQQQDDPF